MQTPRILPAIMIVSVLGAGPPLALPAFSATSDALPQAIQEFFAVLNSSEETALSEFLERFVSGGFRSRWNAEENRNFFQRLRTDLGAVEIRRLEITNPAQASVEARAERLPMPVTFGFELDSGKIDSISVRIGGPPPGTRASLDLPAIEDQESLSIALDEQLRRRAAEGRFSGVVLVAQNGQPVFHRGYGLADRSRDRRVTTDTRFDVGSITKLLTRVAVARLAQEGALSLDDRILEYLPDYPRPEIVDRVIVRHLLDHTSGLGDIFNNRWAEAERSRFRKPSDFLELFVDEPLLFEPGERRSYSNAGFILLGAIVETTSKTPYSTYIEQNVFTPAGMSRSGFLARDGSLPDVAIGYTRGGPTGGDVHAGGEERPNLGMLPVVGCPAGSSTHTAKDLLKLDVALRSAALLDPQWTAWVYGSDVLLDDPSYTLGVAGGGPGVSTGLESNGETTVIVLANLDPPAGDRLAVEIFRALR